MGRDRILVGSNFDGIPKPEALNRTNNSLHNEYLQAMLFVQKGICCMKYHSPNATRINEDVMESQER